MNATAPDTAIDSPFRVGAIVFLAVYLWCMAFIQRIQREDAEKNLEAEKLHSQWLQTQLRQHTHPRATTPAGPVLDEC
jgi:hypothetical protein